MGIQRHDLRQHQPRGVWAYLAAPVDRELRSARETLARKVSATEMIWPIGSAGSLAKTNASNQKFVRRQNVR